MNSLFQKPVIFYNPSRELPAKIAEATKRTLESRGVSPHIEKSEVDWSGEVVSLPSNVSLVITVGGDGTLLQAAHRYNKQVPILGINAGHVGFMTGMDVARSEYAVSQLQHALHLLLDDDVQFGENKTLDVVVRDKAMEYTVGWAVNDVVVSRGANPHLIVLQMTVDGNPAIRYRCDGLIVSTACGSTAYNLAAGGPIISPKSNCFCITPICPQALSSRSLVVDSNETIDFEFTDHSSVIVTCDSNRVPVSNGKLKIAASAKPLVLVYPKHWNYYGSLSKKLGWSGDYNGDCDAKNIHG